MNRMKWFKDKNVLPVVIVFLAAGILVFAGWLIKDDVTNQTQVYIQNGIVSSLPAGWSVQPGVAGEEMIFSAFLPLDRDFRLIASLVPAAPGGTSADLVSLRTVHQADLFQNYQVHDQSMKKVAGKSVLTVSYFYVQPGSNGQYPRVIRGVEAYLVENDKVILAAMENEARNFEESIPTFDRFVSSIRFSAGR